MLLRRIQSGVNEAGNGRTWPTDTYQSSRSSFVSTWVRATIGSKWAGRMKVNDPSKEIGM